MIQVACGVPVVATSADASREVVRDGWLGVEVDPDDLDSVKAEILEALRAVRGVSDGLGYFTVERFRERWQAVVNRCFRERAASAKENEVHCA